MRRHLLIATLALLASLTHAAAPISLLGDDPLSALKPQGRTNCFDVTSIPVTGQPFDRALHIDVRRGATAVWDAQIRAKCPKPIHEGDVIHLTYWVRGLSTESEIAEVVLLNALQKNLKPYTKIFEAKPAFSIPNGWTLFQKAFVSKHTFKPNDYVLNFQFGGFDPQTFEIGGLSILNYGPEYDISTLPTSKRQLYTGHEPDAPWRTEALQRIDRIRKANLSIRVVDAAGKPVPNATVRVDMTRHAFGWGSALHGWTFSSDSPDAQRYRAEFLRLFNLLVPENGLKWPSWEQEHYRNNTLRMIQWARENHCEVRGHTLVWPSFRRSPKSLEALRSNPTALRTAIQDHIRDIASTTHGSIRAWDVVNEPTTNSEFIHLLGEDSLAEWFRLAHQADPQAQLFLNENQILAGTKLQSLEHYADLILKHGGPLGGIGIQGHVGYGTCPPQRMLEIFSRLSSKYHVPLSITELDINEKDESLQAQYLRDILIAAFSHPAIDSVTFWGFWEGRHWLNNTPFYRKDWSPKPGLHVYEDLVLNQWTTHQTLLTNPNGEASLRAFLGSYTISVDTTSTSLSLLKDSASITLQLPAQSHSPAP